MTLDVTVKEVGATPGAGWHSIFNDEPNYGEFEGQSTGREPTGELSAECCAEVEEALAGAGLLFQGQEVTHVVGARSLEGCLKQAVHTGMDPTHPIFQRTWQHVPKGVLYFPGGGQFCVHPTGLSCQAPPNVVQVPPRVAVVFRSDLRHCGAPYPGGNRRAFSYVDVPGHSRAVLRGGELTTDVSYPCVPDGEHQKGCPLLRSVPLDRYSMIPGSTLTTRRLDRALGHLPLPTSGHRRVCQLHSWHTKEVLKLTRSAVFSSKHVMRCEVCNVNLCGQCFYSFHTDAHPKPAYHPPRA